MSDFETVAYELFILSIVATSPSDAENLPKTNINQTSFYITKGTAKNSYQPKIEKK